MPQGSRWIYEVKLDGYRMQAHLRQGKPFFLTRRGYDWTERVPHLKTAMAAVPANNVVFDCELVFPGDDGVPDFAALQVSCSKAKSAHLHLYAFDLLHLDGFDLRDTPLEGRKDVLQQLLKQANSDSIHFHSHAEGDGPRLFDAACRMGLEGIVCKARDAPYRSGKRREWLKVKCPLNKARREMARY